MSQPAATEMEDQFFKKCVEEVLERRRELVARLADSEKETPMPLVLSDADADRVRRLMSTGEFADETAVFAAALDLLERRQRFRALVQEGIDDLEHGRVYDHETVFAEARRRIAAVAAERQTEAVP